MSGSDKTEALISLEGALESVNVVSVEYLNFEQVDRGQFSVKVVIGARDIA